MRIRRLASKILGSGSVAFSSPTPPPPQAAQFAAGVEGILCELNCSPWDVMPNPKEEEGEDGGILGINLEAAHTILSTAPYSSSIATEFKREEKKAKKAKKRKEIEIVTAMPNCKKSDGKGWHCKRPAHPNHSLCHYHLAQLRSYSLSNRTQTNNDVAKTTSEVGEGAAGSSEFYYYYSGFGPSRAKRRSGANARVQEEEEGLAGDDEYDLESLEEEEEGDDGSDDRYLVKDLKGGGEGEEKSGKLLLIKKRGRKPVKARSLKSLL